MAGPRSLIGLLWAAFVLCWLILAQSNKKASTATPLWAGWGMRVAIIVGVLLMVSLRRHAVAIRLASISRSPPLHLGVAGQWAGVGLCLAGFAFAVWARIYLGRNWGMPMSLRQGHELVTSGPYAYVRHPIYAGIMLAMIGSALTESLGWMLVFVLYFAYFLFSARSEEKTMQAQFPDAYPTYRRRTKMLIPFLF
ncbi:MAG TPA: isoprenylcysteine carboxylmethyltransferase family protein [Steroidobacteraceae bacterium]|jgi:protein-S-isoprenylcysteine O-methyltransferase Ste14